MAVTARTVPGRVGVVAAEMIAAEMIAAEVGSAAVDVMGGAEPDERKEKLADEEGPADQRAECIELFHGCSSRCDSPNAQDRERVSPVLLTALSRDFVDRVKRILSELRHQAARLTPATPVSDVSRMGRNSSGPLF